MQALVTTTANQSSGIPWTAAVKTVATDIKPKAPAACKSSLQETVVFGAWQSVKVKIVPIL